MTFRIGSQAQSSETRPASGSETITQTPVKGYKDTYRADAKGDFGIVAPVPLFEADPLRKTARNAKIVLRTITRNTASGLKDGGLIGLVVGFGPDGMFVPLVVPALVGGILGLPTGGAIGAFQGAKIALTTHGLITDRDPPSLGSGNLYGNHKRLPDYRAVEQDSVNGNCWVLASLISYAKQQPHFLKSKLKYHGKGMVTVSGLYNPNDGSPLESKTFNVVEEASKRQMKLRSDEGVTQAWAIAIDCAVNKVLEEHPFSHPNYLDVTSTSTGGYAFVLHRILTGAMSKQHSVAKTDEAELLSLVKDALGNGYPLQLSGKADARPRERNPYGFLFSMYDDELEGRHCWAIVGTHESDAGPKISVTDPHGYDPKDMSPKEVAERFDTLTVAPLKSAVPVEKKQFWSMIGHTPAVAARSQSKI